MVLCPLTSAAQHVSFRSSMKQLDLVEEHREGFAGQEEGASQGRHRLSRRIVSSTVSRSLGAAGGADWLDASSADDAVGR
jgi:hypothetical protein